MASTTGSIAVDASPEAIIEVIAALDEYPLWAEGVQSVEVLATDASGRPAQARFDVNAGFVKGWYVVDYTWSDDAVRWTLVDSPLLKELDGSYVLAGDGTSTQVTYALTAVPAIPMLGALRRKAEQQLVDVALRSLADRLAEVSA